jgi:branched-chain amino acid transport system permease protein
MASLRRLLARAWVPEALTALVLVVAPFVLAPMGAGADLLSRILIWGLFGLGFDLLFGYTGLLSFGQSAFFGTGGFLAAYLLTGNIITNVVLALALGTLAAAVVGVAVGLVALRRTGIYFAMITLAIAETFFFLENSPLAQWTGGENGLPGVPRPEFWLGFITLKITPGWSLYDFLAVCYFVGLVIARRIVASPVGRILTAIRDNPLRARAVGHAIQRYKLAAFVIAAAYAGLAGGLLGVLQGYMPPEAFGFDTSGQLVMQTVIGGTGTLFGPLVGAAVWLMLHDWLQYGLGLASSWKLVLGLVFVLLVCLFRRGLFGSALAWWQRGAAPDESVPAPPRPVLPAVPRHGPARPQGGEGSILRTVNISKHYGGLVANDDISFAVAEGELRGVIGPNGAGKTTFFKMLTGEVDPSSGRIFFRGQEITRIGVTAICQIGLTKSYQVNQLFAKLTVRENLVISALAERRGKFRLDLLRHIDRVPGLDALVEETMAAVDLGSRADVPVAALAYGEKRRLEIGLALAASPSLLLLDEPLAGMSPQERAATIQLLKQIRRGRTLIVVEHDMDAIFGLAERITVMYEGRILAEGTPAEIQDNRFVQEAYLGGVHAA